MSRWGKNIVVPLDSLYKEKENTNRPTVARSVGTVGKWGKMGFTSTRTYALSSLPAAVAAAAAAASPAQSPASLDDDLSPSVPEPPKPKKFFKSRNAAPPEVIAQIIQNLPRTSTSPVRDSTNTSSLIALSNSAIVREPIKLKIPKSTSAEKKTKSPKKPKAVKTEPTKEVESSVVITPTKPSVEHKSKKKKEEKKLKPEAPPSRVTSRARKTVNYCEDDDDERSSTPLKDVLLLKGKTEAGDIPSALPAEPVLPPPPLPLFAASAAGSALSAIANAASKTPEHPPIVLRISKGTSRLVSSDSEEQQPNAIASPLHSDAEPVKATSASTEESYSNTASTTITQTAPKITVKPPKPPSPDPQLPTDNDESTEINYCTVKISPDKPPKERLKLIIKTDVIRNAIAAAAAAEAAKAVAGEKPSAPDASTTDSERPEREKKSKNKKHKHPKHSAVEQLIPAQGSVHSEFKTPSPNLTLGPSIEPLQSHINRIISPTALSERDFDSQSSVLGSISSKGNSTPQLLSQTAPEESCVVRSRGSSVITSDLETSQHSSLVAPPSDIELRLESMMMDNDASQQRSTNVVEEEPLQEDILSVLRGDETEMDSVSLEPAKLKGAIEGSDLKPEDEKAEAPSRRVTRGRTKTATRTNNVEKDEVMPQETPQTPRTRNRKHVANSPPTAEEAPAPKRMTRRGGKKDDEPPMEPLTVKVNPTITDGPPTVTEKLSPNKSEEENTPVEMPVIPPKRGRSTRNTTNNNNLSNNNNNNNINKIAASLSAKAGAAEVSKVTASASTASTVAPRSYGGRKRKNQQVTQVLQPSAEEIEEQQHITPPKVASVEQLAQEASTAMAATAFDSTIIANTQSQAQNPPLQPDSDSDAALVPPNSLPASPPRRDYQIKDKFKRTLMLENQEEEQQRGSVKLVISKKKGSIFKSRTWVPNDQTEQTAATKRHLYKHRWDAEVNGSTTSDGVPTNKATDAQTPATSRTASDGVYDDDFNEEVNQVTRSRDNSPSLAKIGRGLKPMPLITNNAFDMDEDMHSPTEPVPSLRSERRSDYYTRVCNVKTAHQIQEIGEYQEMDDDVEYILDALKPENPTPTRCLSALQLAAKCMTPTFRMHVRAHGVVTKFFKALSDANRDLSLGLCTSAIMFILSQEGLNMDLDRDALELMMNLLESEGVAAPSDQANYERNKQKVREFCEEIKAQGKATHLNVDSITVGTLAMETLLSLTSKRAGEWFKEELRNLGGLEHIIKTISDCSQPLKDASGINWTQSVFDNIQTVARCMRVLENVTQMNEENQKYMLTYANGSAVNNLCTLYVICDRELKINPTTELNSKRNSLLLELLTSLTKVLINLTHTFSPSNALGAETIGKRTDVIETSLCLLLQSTNYIPDRCIFELSILVLLLLINLTMYTVENRVYIMKANVRNESRCHDQETDITAVQAVMEYFYRCEELARLVEKSTDDILDNTNKNKKKQEELDETVNNLLQTAGHHMEHTLKGSYAGILIGHLITDSDEFETIVRKHLRGNGFQEIISVLEKYYTFMNLTASSEASAVAHIQSMKKLIDYFKKRDYVFEMNKQENDCVLPLNLETHHSSADHESPSTASRSTQRVYKTYSQR